MKRAPARDWKDEEELASLPAQAAAQARPLTAAGLIYGMGHAVYSLSDPRAVIFKGFVEQLAHEKGRDKDLRALHQDRAPGPAGDRGGAQNLSRVSAANVDFYSGFVYEHAGHPAWSCTRRMFAVGPRDGLERPPH